MRIGPARCDAKKSAASVPSCFSHASSKRRARSGPRHPTRLRGRSTSRPHVVGTDARSKLITAVGGHPYSLRILQPFAQTVLGIKAIYEEFQRVGTAGAPR